MRTDGRDEWVTPWHEYERICHYWNTYPTIDAFADKNNSKCPYHINLEMDAFKTDWIALAEELGVDPIFWVQPPYTTSILVPALERAIEMAERGATSLFLIPSWTDREWYHRLIYNKFAHRFWTPENPKPDQKTYRIKFEPPPGIKPSSPRYGNIHGVIL